MELSTTISAHCSALQT
ncbi:hypothetical protein AZE42_11750 [Rhizopogon vesiculosus]|uniref:Uncharacterized protein n=1 Tax=Rhizopogon vesiculosus TaxID=180088 RepID=A0A1J8QH99_9AGAM|nr:hypothetical protein AZE42_11750 [Rhizopogon vesiculosus]